MKLYELMIGDLVLIHEPECKGHRIDYISEIDEEVGADGELYQIDDIKPIPLTDEILENNGFKRELSEDNIHYRFILIYNGVRFSLLYARSVFQWLGPLDFKYVHELQHAMRLCNIEKEIEL